MLQSSILESVTNATQGSDPSYGIRGKQRTGPYT